MGAILRLDGPTVEIESQDVEAVGCITRTWGDPDAKSGTGRLWRIGVHPKPELRLKLWAKRGNAIRPGASDVVIDHGGTLDFFDLAPGWYLADSATVARDVARSVVFRVLPGARAELVTAAAGVAEERDLVLAGLSGWSLDRLRAERGAYAADLAAQAEADGLPPLVGNAGAVVWANEFRRTKLAHALEYVTGRFDEAKTEEHPGDESGHGLAAVWLGAALDYMRGIDDAGWWVAHVNRPGAELVRGLAVAGYRGKVELVNDEGRAVG